MGPIIKVTVYKGIKNVQNYKNLEPFLKSCGKGRNKAEKQMVAIKTRMKIILCSTKNGS